MVVEYIRYVLPVDRSAEFESAYIRAQAWLHLSPWCRAFELSRCADDPAHYVLRIEWTSAEDHLVRFRAGEHFPPFLSEIRPFIHYIQEMRHYQPTSVASSTSIHASAGGDEAFARLAAELHDRLSADDRLGGWFQSAASSHTARLTAWLIQVFGGAPAYTDACGDIAPMLMRHANMDISEELRTRFVQRASEAVAAVWPDRPDVVAAVVRYFEWGSHIAVENSRPGHRPNPAAGVPRWGWKD